MKQRNLMASVLLAAVYVGTLVIWATPAIASVTVVDSALVSQKRVSRFVFEYEYRVRFENTGVEVAGGVATVESSSSRSVIVDATVEVPPLLGGGAALSADTYKIRQDRRFRFDRRSLSWTVSPRFPVVRGDESRFPGAGSVFETRTELGVDVTAIAVIDASPDDWSVSEVEVPGIELDRAVFLTERFVAVRKTGMLSDIPVRVRFKAVEVPRHVLRYLPDEDVFERLAYSVEDDGSVEIRSGWGDERALIVLEAQR